MPPPNTGVRRVSNHQGMTIRQQVPSTSYADRRLSLSSRRSISQSVPRPRSIETVSPQPQANNITNNSTAAVAPSLPSNSAMGIPLDNLAPPILVKIVQRQLFQQRIVDRSATNRGPSGPRPTPMTDSLHRASNSVGAESGPGSVSDGLNEDNDSIQQVLHAPLSPRSPYSYLYSDSRHEYIDRLHDELPRARGVDEFGNTVDIPDEIVDERVLSPELSSSAVYGSGVSYRKGSNSSCYPTGLRSITGSFSPRSSARTTQHMCNSGRPCDFSPFNSHNNRSGATSPIFGSSLIHQKRMENVPYPHPSKQSPSDMLSARSEESI